MRNYPLGRRYATLHVETLYRTLDAGLCCGTPCAAPVGLVVQVMDPRDFQAAWRESFGVDARVLCVAEIDGAPAYGWLLLSWLEPINPQRELFPTEQPTLFA